MKFTQKLTIHINGGKKFSELRYDIFADGKATNLRRATTTSGSPKYLKTQDVIWDTERPDDPKAVFDVLKACGVGLTEWLEANVKVTGETPAAPT